MHMFMCNWHDLNIVHVFPVSGLTGFLIMYEAVHQYTVDGGSYTSGHFI